MDRGALRYWSLVGALALLVAGVTGRTVAEAERRRAAWGRTTTVWVTTEAVRAGDRLAGAVEERAWPDALVSASMVDRLDPDAEAAADLAAGMPIAAGQLRGTDDVDAADRRSTIALPVAAALPLRAGDQVDVWASAEETTQVASDALVVSAADDVVVVAVLADEVAQVAAASADATMVVTGRR